uniref:SMB domain-containing protein n=1 Tax=Erpetoichthys calabaricus TaxID=27687 RepID=A0A8C4SQD7_ERPCA
MQSVHQLQQLKLSIIDSCHERCGEVYYRGHNCHCDYSCLIHKECCLDYEVTCTTGNSCKGRCGEVFQRGKPCDCDNECSQFGKCCPDYRMHCMNVTAKTNLSNDSNLCSGRPANGMTTLRNGTTFVFRGHFFWMLNAHGVEAGYPRKITEEWGIPSPIDTVFTRCNCQGKTFFFKGKNYWRFENGSLDPGYPKLIAKGFNGLSGKITAALSVSAHQRRMESVYFFKQGTVAYLDVKALVIHPCHMKMSSISEVCLNGALGNTHHVQALNLEFLKHFFFAEQTDCIFIPGYATKLVIYPNSRRFD